MGFLVCFQIEMHPLLVGSIESLQKDFMRQFPIPYSPFPKSINILVRFKIAVYPISLFSISYFLIPDCCNNFNENAPILTQKNYANITKSFLF